MTTIFLIGAGFNVDANSLVQPYRATNFYGEIYNINAAYPVISELASIAFPNETVVDFEERLAEAITKRDYGPMDRVIDALMRADHYVGSRLGESGARNIYDEFLSWCGPAFFVTFNYDAFLELRLFKTQQWYPHDGFGVPVQVGLIPAAGDELNKRSTHQVLHLHGSYLLYTVDFNVSQPDDNNIRWIIQTEQPRFLFDPDALGQHFIPFKRVSPSYGYQRPEFRVIAPVPDKAEGLSEVFIQKCYQDALGRVIQSQRLISIGYSFSRSDRRSFAPILEKFVQTKGGSITVIDPNAKKIVEYLKTMFPAKYRPIPWRFGDWVRRGFPEDANA